MARLALLTKASIRPYFRSIIVSMLIIGFIRHVCLMKRPAVDVAVAWPLASSMSETIMIAPSRAVRSTIAEPMPIALPVISATFPSHAVPWLFFSQAAFRINRRVYWKGERPLDDPSAIQGSLHDGPTEKRCL